MLIHLGLLETKTYRGLTFYSEAGRPMFRGTRPLHEIPQSPADLQGWHGHSDNFPFAALFTDDDFFCA